MIHTEQPKTGEIQRKPNKLLRFLVNYLLPLTALLAGIALTFYLLKTSPEAKPRKRPPMATLVEVKTVAGDNQQTILTAMGEIIPARQVSLKPRVSGEVVSVSSEFVPGGFFSEGKTALGIDRTDYELVLAQLESDARKAESDLILEMGSQRIASREFSLLGESVTSEEKALILREPQLAKLEAARSYAQSRLAKARLDLERTDITIPFNAVVMDKQVELGAKVNESTILAELVGTDSFWLRLTLPVDKLRWIEIPESSGQPGSRVTIFSPGGGEQSTRTGTVIRLEPSLEEQGRMARLLINIDDPLSLTPENRTKPKLLLGSYVTAEISGKTIDHGILLDRKYLRDNDTVWLMNEEGLLEIRPVKVLFRERNHVIVNTGIDSGDRIVTSSLTAPIAGTPLRLPGDNGGQKIASNKKEKGQGLKKQGGQGGN